MQSTSKKKALLALVLVAPAPSLGVLIGLHATNQTLAVASWAFFKVWLLGMPLLWHRWVDREPWSLSPAKKGGFGVSLGVGLAIGAIIFAAYGLLGPYLIDPATVQEQAAKRSLDQWSAYLGLGLYIILLNSVLEEFVFRWFLFRKCEQVGGQVFAVAGSAIIFMTHHVFPLIAYFQDAPTVILCTLGTGVGGAVWSWMYLKYRSVWVPYVSHAIVDVAMLAVGALIIFGN